VVFNWVVATWVVVIITVVKIVLQRRHFAGTRLLVSLKPTVTIFDVTINDMDCIQRLLYPSGRISIINISVSLIMNVFVFVQKCITFSKNIIEQNKNGIIINNFCSFPCTKILFALLLFLF